MDDFIEILIVKKKTFADAMLSTGLYTLALILSVAISAVFYLNKLGNLILIAIVALFYFAYRINSQRNIEFEYSLVNNDLDIDKIISQRKRKRVLSFKCSDIEVMAPVSSNECNSNFQKETAGNIINVTSGTRANFEYFAVIKKDNENIRLIFEPSHKMVEVMRKYNPRNIII